MSLIEIPNKPFFNLNEVSGITSIKPYVLRFWEAEFSELIKPINSEHGQKLYERKDIEGFLLIKKMLFEDKLPISEAKLKLNLLEPKVSEELISSSVSIVRQSLSEKDVESILEVKVLLKHIIEDVSQLKNTYQF